MTNEELQKEMIAAMKAKDKVRLSIIRQVKAEVKNIEVNERRDVTEEDVNSMIKRLIKQTSETLEMSIKAGTDQERTDNLTEQVKILESLLPAQVSGEELEALIEQVIAELGATSKKQMGQVMGVWQGHRRQLRQACRGKDRRCQTRVICYAVLPNRVTARRCKPVHAAI